MAHHDITKHDISDDPELKISFGEHVPDVDMTKGKYVNFGILAGSSAGSAKSLSPERICFEDSIADNRRNQPKSH